MDIYPTDPHCIHTSQEESHYGCHESGDTGDGPGETTGMQAEQVSRAPPCVTLHNAIARPHLLVMYTTDPRRRSATVAAMSLATPATDRERQQACRQRK